jgi:hypothetical protein
MTIVLIIAIVAAVLFIGYAVFAKILDRGGETDVRVVEAPDVRAKELEPGDVALRDSVIQAIKIAGSTPDLLCPNGLPVWEGNA